MSKINMKKLEERLQEVQKGCTARLMTKNDITNIITDLQTKRERILNTPIDKKYLKEVRINYYYTVPKSYRYPADTTSIFATISRYGKITINISRGQTHSQSYGGTNYKVTPIFN
jgi:hypothetical protein